MMSSSSHTGLLSGLLILVFFSCRESTSSEKISLPVARVYDKYLYRNDLPSMEKKGISAEDSIEITREFINEWIGNSLLLHHAEVRFNGTPVLENINRQASDYRSALLIYAFQREINRQPDTLVTENDLAGFIRTGNRTYRPSDSVASREDTLYMKHMLLNERRYGRINAIINRFQDEAIEKNAIEIFI